MHAGKIRQKQPLRVKMQLPRQSVLTNLHSLSSFVLPAVVRAGREAMWLDPLELYWMLIKWFTWSLGGTDRCITLVLLSYLNLAAKSLSERIYRVSASLHCSVRQKKKNTVPEELIARDHGHDFGFVFRRCLISYDATWRVILRNEFSSAMCKAWELESQNRVRLLLWRISLKTFVTWR